MTFTPGDWTTVPRWRGPVVDTPQTPDGPWIADVHSFDVPETIKRCIMSVGPGCVAIVLVDRGGRKMREVAEQAARKRGIVVLWEDRTTS